MSVHWTGNEPGAERVNALSGQDAPHGRCLECSAPLPPPAARARLPRKFCIGQVCRSRWHNKRKRALIAAALESTNQLIDIIRELAR